MALIDMFVTVFGGELSYAYINELQRDMAVDIYLMPRLTSPLQFYSPLFHLSVESNTNLDITKSKLNIEAMVFTVPYFTPFIVRYSI